MVPKHPPSRIPHHGPNLLAHGPPIAVNRTLCAGRLLSPERAALDPGRGIILQGLAFRTQRPPPARADLGNRFRSWHPAFAAGEPREPAVGEAKNSSAVAWRWWTNPDHSFIIALTILFVIDPDQNSSTCLFALNFMLPKRVAECPPDGSITLGVFNKIAGSGDNPRSARLSGFWDRLKIPSFVVPVSSIDQEVLQ